MTSNTLNKDTAETLSGSMCCGGRQGHRDCQSRRVGRPAGYPRATLVSKNKPSSDKDVGLSGRARTETSTGARATGETSGRSLLVHINPLYLFSLYLFTVIRLLYLLSLYLFTVIRLLNCSHCFWTSEFSVKRVWLRNHSCFFDTIPLFLQLCSAVVCSF